MINAIHRRNELYQVALQASCIGDLMEVIHTSLSLMQKQWSEAMNIFHEKFDPLASLIVDHGSFNLFYIFHIFMMNSQLCLFHCRN